MNRSIVTTTDQCEINQYTPEIACNNNMLKNNRDIAEISVTSSKLLQWEIFISMISLLFWHSVIHLIMIITVGYINRHVGAQINIHIFRLVHLWISHYRENEQLMMKDMHLFYPKDQKHSQFGRSLSVLFSLTRCSSSFSPGSVDSLSSSLLVVLSLM